MGLFEIFCDTIARRPGIDALLFDLDGTLVNTVARHYAAYKDVFASYDGAFSRADFDQLSGPPAQVTIPRFAAAAGLLPEQLPIVATLHRQKKDNFARALATDPPDTLPAAEILRHAAGRMRIAIVTSGNCDGARAILRATGLKTAIDVLVTGDDVASGKPDPAPYLLGLELLGVPAAQALAFEDHDDGILSATRAGLPTLDVRSGKIEEPLSY